MKSVSLESWIEWKHKCAAALCQTSVKSELAAFAKTRFEAYARKNTFRTNDPEGHLLQIEPWQAWHLLEVHFTARESRDGKRYKDWLFARTQGSTDSALDVIQGGATLLMRDVVREYIRQECTAWGTVSIQKPRSNESMAPTVEDLLPGTADPLTDVENREYEELAKRHAGTVFADMAMREKVALAAKEMGVSLADARVAKQAGCKKSVISTAYISLIERIGAFVRQQHPDEDSLSLIYLTERTLALVKTMIFKESSENGGALAFLLIDEDKV